MFKSDDLKGKEKKLKEKIGWKLYEVSRWRFLWPGWIIKLKNT